MLEERNQGEQRVNVKRKLMLWVHGIKSKKGETP
jgi:hypothetical protein